MIALDSSALVAIVMDEPERDEMTRIISEHDCIIGAPTRFETVMVIRSRTTDWHMRNLLRLLRLGNVQTVAYTDDHAQASQVAFEKYGKGTGHRAQLNFGDCMAYAIAQAASVPLLFKGNDFTQTDIIPAHAP